MTIIVHGVWGSPYMRGALLGLEERGVSYKVNAIELGAHLQAPHLERHPFGRVPVFDHDDFRLYETQAILRYVANVFPGPALQPVDPRAAARMDQLIGITDWYFFNQIAIPISRPRFLERVGRVTPDEEAIRAAVPQAGICLRVIDRRAPYAAPFAAIVTDGQLTLTDAVES
jgi:glutathione S-transferase